MLLTVDFTAASNEAAVELAQHLGHFLGAEPTPGGLLSFRVARHGEHTTRIIVVEEWTDAAMQQHFVARPEFATFMAEIAPLLAGMPHGDTFDIVNAGPISNTAAP